MGKFVIKNPRQLGLIRKPRLFAQQVVNNTPIVEVNDSSTPKNNVIEEIKEEKKVNDMNTQEKIAMAATVLSEPAPKAKRIRKDKGLIERTESSTIVLTEDNKELLND